MDWHPRGEATWPGWKTARPGLRLEHVRSGRQGTLRRVVTGRTPGSRYVVVQWDNDAVGRPTGPGEGVTGRVVAPAFDLRPVD